VTKPNSTSGNPAKPKAGGATPTRPNAGGATPPNVGGATPPNVGGATPPNAGGARNAGSATPNAGGTAAAAEPGFYSVDSTPYATIFIDGKRLGDTPLFRERVPSGAHQVRAVRADGREQKLAIQVLPGKELNSGRLAW
jgi:serine/threonine-protein kinase